MHDKFSAPEQEEEESEPNGLHSYTSDFLLLSICSHFGHFASQPARGHCVAWSKWWHSIALLVNCLHATSSQYRNLYACAYQALCQTISCHSFHWRTCHKLPNSNAGDSLLKRWCKLFPIIKRINFWIFALFDESQWMMEHEVSDARESKQ